MGRGRQKAKQAKIARDLKYYSPETDFSALQRELSGQQSQSSWSDDDDDEYPEQWAEKYSDE
ncbi:DUF3073 domain-containing protein [Helcobacillus massiliensis]|uniref:DUF3073 family protein n=1 Tax=Helcobacillus massiliensis TaxID=521392 RepID=A0A839QRW3_9MICO|nr:MULTISPECIES: DUF3073 domain-containing protein [Helcobacillus]MBB3023044.1 hypothetical protein [Helcobacillus massiliensis]MCG7426057.1 DUF3073 domain-containing protein [Helcobacillus sp. ACRRO]MCT1558375.1 DUF3073 domain-containing protein [Helcobacillus massiliensis]MCT2036853.1 DUF3073 domain-containing protein [Helcobacillus massiliensis]MCT2332634.1 DUF3073 domain-containing protein [Helcobacillus massiliensis]